MGGIFCFDVDLADLGNSLVERLTTVGADDDGVVNVEIVVVDRVVDGFEYADYGELLAAYFERMSN